MIAVAGRALDIQAGFGLAFLIDPTTRAQTPLVGALFTYAAGAIFFTTGGASNLLLAIARANQLLPIGSVVYKPDLQALLLFLSTISIMAVGAVGLLLTVLFLIDLTVALLSRTLPQMNVLVLGFQIKAFTTLVLLPVTIGLSASLIARILSLAVELVPRLA
jgi:flagellar biosynthetic protein FliR